MESKRKATIWEYETRIRMTTQQETTQSPEETDTEYCVTLINWANSYLDHSERRHSKKTYKEKMAVFQNMIRSGIFSPDMSVRDIHPSLVIRYMDRQSEKRSGYAANKERKNLIVAWRWGERYIVNFPSMSCPFDIARYPEIRKPRYIPPEEDFWAIVDVAKGQEKTMLLTFLYTAARRGEIFRLTWEDVDFGKNRIRLWTKKREGGSMESDWIPMTSSLRENLRNWRDKRPVKDSPYVFVVDKLVNANQETYGKPYAEHGKMMSRLCRRAGVKSFGFHAIRHLTASILFQNGETIQVIQSVLRHKSARTTERYLHSLGIESVRAGLESISSGSAADVIRLEDRKSERQFGGTKNGVRGHLESLE
jgi:integrase